MKSREKRRRVVTLLLVACVPIGFFVWFALNPPAEAPVNPQGVTVSDEPLAREQLEKLEVKSHQTASKYDRSEFGNGWAAWNSCDTRQKILARDLTEVVYDKNGCTVLTGVLNDPYTGEVINFVRGTGTSNAVQIDHVVALSNAWSTGASYWDKTKRVQLANDDLELLAVDGKANQQKSNSDASGWLPSNVAFRCQYVARQIAVKAKYVLWVTEGEKLAMNKVLDTCPAQRLPAP